VTEKLDPRLREDDVNSGGHRDSSISDRIDEERGRLMTAETLLHCAVVAMEEGECDEDADAPHYPSVINQARDLMSRSIRELEAIGLESRPKDSKHEVREEAPAYVH
jgi:hypothetical protein